MIIGLIGEKLAGKDTAAEYFVKHFGADHIRTSHILDELLDVLGLPKTRRNEIDIGSAVEQAFGKEILGEAVVRRIKASTAEIIVNNGLRQEYQFQQARRMGATIIYITAPLELRYKRSQSRTLEAKEPGQTFEEFKKQDSEWIEASIPRLGAKADFVIHNTGTLTELENQLEAIVKQVRKSP